MKQAKHRYRVSIYLGKETYQQIERLAIELGIPVATMTRIILDTGLQISKANEKGSDAIVRQMVDTIMEGICNGSK